MRYLGVDIGGTKIAAGIVDENFHILAEETVPTNVAGGPNAITADIVRAVRAACAQAGTCVEAFPYVGIGCAGTIDAKAGVVKDDGELIATSSEPLSDYSDTGVVRSLVKVCNNALEAAGLKWSDIGEIGIGSPGTIDFDVVYYTYRLFIEWHCY